MKNKRGKILAIDPGIRHIGFALFDRGELVHYGVKTILKAKSQRETLKKGRKIILRMINDFRPQILVVEKTYFANNKDSALLNIFTSEIKAVGKRKNLDVESLAANSVRKRLCGNGRAKKDDVAREVVSRFPELKPYLASDRRWKEEYYGNMFDTVALGIIASDKLI